MSPTAEPTSLASSIEIDEVLRQLSVDRTVGLSGEEASRRLASHGPNELPVEPPTPAWRLVVGQLANPLTILLLAAIVVSAVAWGIDRQEAVPYEAIVILAIVIFNAILGWLQESRAEQAMAALQAMTAPHARVRREGQPLEIEAREVVPGDILLLDEGDTVSADARVIESISMRMAEATLTGESTPVSKDPSALAGDVALGDQRNMVFSGTAVAAGRGVAVVTATGARTQLGAIAGALQRTVQDSTPLQRNLDRVGRSLGVLVLAIAIVMALTIVVVDGLHSFSDLVEVLILTVSLAVAAVPEGLTAITTIVLSLGMKRMAQRNVIVRRLAAVETLGSTTDICSDKTGTLTRNEMTVRSVITSEGRVDLSGTGYDPQGEILVKGSPLEDGRHRMEVQRALEAAALVNNATLSRAGEAWTITGDPTEAALIAAAVKAGLDPGSLNLRYDRLHEIPFSSERKRMTTVHRIAGEDEAVILSKGAPDVLLAACRHEWADGQTRDLTPARRAEILASVDSLASEALRTLGIAYRPIHPSRLTDETDDSTERDLIWLGLVGMIDPPRPEAIEAVRVAHKAGIRPVMITGDHPRTAEAIAEELAIARPDTPAVAGIDLDAMDDAALQRAVRSTTVYARVAPEHKLRIVRALQAEGRIVAMTGDGVNDAPALKAADIGIAMGITGTDVSRGAADMVLTDDNFASIVAAMEEGRSIFANIRKFLWFLLSSNVGEVLVMFLGVLGANIIGLVSGTGSGIVAPLTAVQLLWINLLTDAAPALALGMDPADRDVMDRPPRDPSQPVIDRSMWTSMLAVGLILAAGTLLIADAALPGGLIDGSGSVHYAQTMAFTTLVLFQLFNVFNARTGTGSALANLFTNRWIWLAIASSLALQFAVVYLAPLHRAFGTVPLSLSDWLACALVSSSVLWLAEIARAAYRVTVLRGK